MTLRAAQNCLAGRTWPVGRRLESPAINSHNWSKNESVGQFFNQHQKFQKLLSKKKKKSESYC